MNSPKYFPSGKAEETKKLILFRVPSISPLGDQMKQKRKEGGRKDTQFKNISYFWGILITPLSKYTPIGEFLDRDEPRETLWKPTTQKIWRTQFLE